LITGRNGAGKSSLLRMVGGLVRIAGGRLDLTGSNPELSIAEQAHYLGHQDALKPALTVAENLDFWVRYLGGGVQSNAALAAMGLERLADLPAGYLSAGQRRRLAIARLIAVKRPIWLLDEPNTALDQGAQAGLAKVMTEHLSAGGMILAAVHGPIELSHAQELRLGAAP
jgi:heme exporter protein A